jgi:carboxymethylenebutenolidase
MGQTIEIASRDGSCRFGAYLATPSTGRGPGIVICPATPSIDDVIRHVADRYAQEGYVAMVPDLFWRPTPSLGAHASDLDAALAALRERPEVQVDAGIGAVGFGKGGTLAYVAACRYGVTCAISYGGPAIADMLDEIGAAKRRFVLHLAEHDESWPPSAMAAVQSAFAARQSAECYVYPGTRETFAREGSKDYDKPAALLAHERSVAALKRAIGPEYDLSALWDKHCEYEFATRDVDATMATMVAQPYVNHIPTMTGGVGYRDLKRFYRHHFVHGNPPDTRLIPISRTVGATQVVDEMLFCFTHTCEIDWMLPGVPPTGRYVEIPLIAIVKFRGDKLYHEHIYWDQASVLVQIGLLDPAGLPVADVQTAKKLLDESLPSNTLMARWAESEGLD